MEVDRKIRLQGFNENEPLPQKALKEIGTDGIAGKNDCQE